MGIVIHLRQKLLLLFSAEQILVLPEMIHLQNYERILM